MRNSANGLLETLVTLRWNAIGTTVEQYHGKLAASWNFSAELGDLGELNPGELRDAIVEGGRFGPDTRDLRPSKFPTLGRNPSIPERLDALMSAAFTQTYEHVREDNRQLRKPQP